MTRFVTVLVSAAAFATALASGAGAQDLACGTEVTGDVMLETSLTGCSTGLVVGADGITIDLNGHAIVGLGGVGSVGVQAFDRANVTIRNGFVAGFETGVQLSETRESTVERMTVTGSSVGIGIEFSLDARVVGNALLGNADAGVLCHDRATNGSRIERNYAVGNGTGIRLDRCSGAIVLKNVASGNRSHGIFLDESFSHVEGNTASANGASGIHAFNSHGLFMKNVTNGNAGNGLLIDDSDSTHGAFHTVTSHVANANGGWGIAALLEGTVDGGKNRAHANGAAAQCLNVSCR